MVNIYLSKDAFENLSDNDIAKLEKLSGSALYYHAKPDMARLTDDLPVPNLPSGLYLTVEADHPDDLYLDSKDVLEDGGDHVLILTYNPNISETRAVADFTREAGAEAEL